MREPKIGGFSERLTAQAEARKALLEKFKPKPHVTAPVLETTAQRKARELLARVGLSDKADVYPAQLSGGQQQRLCIARALAVNPEVMLMDEPASALDPISTAKIEDLIFELKQKLTIVIVTHNMQQASRVAEYTGFFLMGNLVEFDKTEKIFTNPSDKRTEDYITGRFG